MDPEEKAGNSKKRPKNHSVASSVGNAEAVGDETPAGRIKRSKVAVRERALMVKDRAANYVMNCMRTQFIQVIYKTL
jgi:hypothetical protein